MFLVGSGLVGLVGFKRKFSPSSETYGAISAKNGDFQGSHIMFSICYNCQYKCSIKILIFQLFQLKEPNCFARYSRGCVDAPI
jgi:hypothetical protein